MVYTVMSRCGDLKIADDNNCVDQPDENVLIKLPANVKEETVKPDCIVDYTRTCQLQ